MKMVRTQKAPAENISAGLAQLNKLPWSATRANGSFEINHHE